MFRTSRDYLSCSVEQLIGRFLQGNEICLEQAVTTCRVAWSSLLVDFSKGTRYV